MESVCVYFIGFMAVALLFMLGFTYFLERRLKAAQRRLDWFDHILQVREVSNIQGQDYYLLSLDAGSTWYHAARTPDEPVKGLGGLCERSGFTNLQPAAKELLEKLMAWEEIRAGVDLSDGTGRQTLMRAGFDVKAGENDIVKVKRSSIQGQDYNLVSFDGGKSWYHAEETTSGGFTNLEKAPTELLEKLEAWEQLKAGINLSEENSFAVLQKAGFIHHEKG